MKAMTPLCLFLACTLSAGSAVVQPEEKAPLTPTEVEFLKEAGQSSLNEVKVATLGSQKSQNAELKKLSATLISDHTMALEKAKALAEKKGLSISTAIDEETAKTYKDLERKSGHEFDTAYIAHLDKTHIKSIKSFEKAQKECQDADLKAWIDENLLVIKAHHELIKKLKDGRVTEP